MSKNLVIVECPAKAKTIEGYLGKDFVVKSSFGHVRDLPEKDLGIDVKNGYIPAYEVSSDKVKVIGEEENSFVEIQNKLGEIAEKFGKDVEEITKCFQQVSCNYGDLELYLA